MSHRCYGSWRVQADWGSLRRLRLQLVKLLCVRCLCRNYAWQTLNEMQNRRLTFRDVWMMRGPGPLADLLWCDFPTMRSFRIPMFTFRPFMICWVPRMIFPAIRGNGNATDWCRGRRYGLEICTMPEWMQGWAAYLNRCQCKSIFHLIICWWPNISVLA